MLGLLLWIGIRTSAASEPFRFPEGTHGQGRLAYVDGIAVLCVTGTPEEMGDQVAALALRPAAPLLGQIDGFVEFLGLKPIYPILLKTTRFMTARFPPDHLRELDAMAETSGQPRDLLILANTFHDAMHVFGCSVIMAEPDRSATGQRLVGRNLDWPPFGGLEQYTLVTVYRPAGKRSFVSVAFPSMIGCVSGMNDAGLVLATLEVLESADGAPRFNPEGVPYMLYMRRVMEECSSVAEAENLIRSLPRTTMHNLALCDKDHAVILEITPKSVVRRSAENGLCCCTNHFRTPELATSTACRRYSLFQNGADTPRFGLAEISDRLHAVNQGELTLQSMIFEPEALRLHLAAGAGPASALPRGTLDLSAFFARGAEAFPEVKESQ
jgi:hypothetical protein